MRQRVAQKEQIRRGNAESHLDRRAAKRPPKLDLDVYPYLPKATVPQPRRREEIRRFRQDPDCRLFLSSEAGGVGLNLQVADTVINMDQPWNPAKLDQRIARAWRKHQHRTVRVFNLVSEGTIEHRMLGFWRRSGPWPRACSTGAATSPISRFPRAERPSCNA